jgi:hypothetical protein
MKRLLLATCLTLVAVAMPPPVTLAQDGSITVAGFTYALTPDAAQIAIVGPDKANPRDEVTLRLNGTPALDLTKPLTDQLGWLMGADRMYVWLASPGQPMVPLDVRGELVFAAAGATMQPIIRFVAGEPGEYRVLVDWHLGQNQLIERVIQVGDKPNPPVPPVPPPTPGERFVLIVSETKDRTPQEAATLATLRRWLTDAKVQWRIIDPTTEAEWMRPHAAKLKEAGVKGTALMVFAQPTDSHPGAYLAVEPLPGRSQEAIARIEEALK